MSVKAKAIYTLYILGKITIDGVRDAVVRDVITVSEYYQITGTEYFD